MIDWVSCFIPYHGPEVGELYIRQDLSTGEMEQAYKRPLHCKGSYDSGIAVQVIGREMYISGNPVKFLSGQNAFGTNDLTELVVATYDTIIRLLGLPDCALARKSMLEGDVRLTRVDCTFHYHVGSDDDVGTWLRAMEQCAHRRYRGRGHYDEGMCSLIFGVNMQNGKKPKGSKHSSFKFYNKLREMAKHKMTCAPDVAAKIKEMVYGEVRAEALYRALELKKLGRDKLAAWDDETAYELHRRWIDQMDISKQVELGDDTLSELPRAVASTYRHWQRGEDLRGLLSRPTFYRHRRVLLEHGVDITSVREGADQLKRRVVPVLEVLVAAPVSEADREAMFWDLVDRAA